MLRACRFVPSRLPQPNPAAADDWNVHPLLAAGVRARLFIQKGGEHWGTGQESGGLLLG